MVDQERVCCLCGDVGFPDKLFRCSRCRFRFQHSYCSNYYCGSENSSSCSSSKEICDWCQSESFSSNSNSNSNSNNSIRHGGSSSRTENLRSEYASGERIKQLQDNHNHNHQQEEHKAAVSSSSTKNSGVPSPRPAAHRRYKLLKDVMC